MRRAGGERGDGHRLDRGERVALEQDAVLERAGLGFVGVAHEVVRLRRPGGDGGPLAPGREGRAAATHQLRGGDLVDDALGTDLDGAGEGRGSRRPPDSRRATSGRRRPTRPSSRDDPTTGRSVAVRPPPRAPVSRAAITPTASIGAMTRRARRLAGDRDQRRGRPVAQPEARAAQPGRAAVSTGSPAGADGPRQVVAQLRSAPARRQAMSSQTWATSGGRGVVANRA